MSRYRRKSNQTIEAWKIPSSMDEEGERQPHWLRLAINERRVTQYADGSYEVITPHGVTIARPGDWIALDVENGVYPIKGAIFDVLYEPVAA